MFNAKLPLVQQSETAKALSEKLAILAEEKSRQKIGKKTESKEKSTKKMQKMKNTTFFACFLRLFCFFWRSYFGFKRSPLRSPLRPPLRLALTDAS